MTTPYYTDHYDRQTSYPDKRIQSSHTPAHSPPHFGYPLPNSTPFPRPPPYPANAPTPANHAGPSRSRGRDYLLSLRTDMNNLTLSSAYREPSRQRTTTMDKPLPQLPLDPPNPPPIPPSPYSSPDRISTNDSRLMISHPIARMTQHQARISDTPPRPCYNSDRRPYTVANPLPTPPRVQTSVNRLTIPKTPPKAFRPSINLYSPADYHPHSEPRVSRPYSDPIVPITPTRRRQEKAKSRTRNPISVIVIDSDSDTPPSDDLEYITTRSPARRKRATSERPPESTRPVNSAVTSTSKKKDRSAVKCAGFTRKGASCQRTVKVGAPFLGLITDHDPTESIGARYCATHAGMICSAKGFYWRNHKEDPGVWIEFSDFIPDNLGQQTQALMRMTMESPLTDKELPGFLYAYELRDLETDTTCYFKIGRTDNVPRRIGEWTTRCRSHAPTLRDIFPLSPSVQTSLQRHPTLPTSYLPGAFRQTTNPDRTCPNVKRWERLVHLELGDLALRHAPEAYEAMKEKCEECQARHREIFPLGKGDEVYRERVMEVICRWEKLMRKITNSTKD